MAMNKSQQLAQLWMTLARIQDDINEYALPAIQNLGIDDPDLVEALEKMNALIYSFFESGRLEQTTNLSLRKALR